MDIAKKVVLYMISQLGEVDVKRLMYLVYLVDRELYYMCGFTLFPWKFVFSGLRSFDVYDVVDTLTDLGYFEKEARDSGVVVKFRRGEAELPKQLRDVVDKVLEKTRGVDNLEEYESKFIDPNVVDIAGL